MDEYHCRRYLQITLTSIGLVFLCLYPLMQVWPSGWMWQPRQHEYEHMMIGVYGTLGVFLLGGIPSTRGTSQPDLVQVLVQCGSRHHYGSIRLYGFW